MKVRTTVHVTMVDHYRAGTPDALTVVTLVGHGEDVLDMHWQIPGWVEIAMGDEYEVELTRIRPPGDAS